MEANVPSPWLRLTVSSASIRGTSTVSLATFRLQKKKRLRAGHALSVKVCFVTGRPPSPDSSGVGLPARPNPPIPSHRLIIQEPAGHVHVLPTNLQK